MQIANNVVRLVIPSRKRTKELFYGTAATITCLLFATVVLANVGTLSNWQSLLSVSMILIVVVTASVLMGALPLMWELDGQEIIQVDSQRFLIRRQAFGLARQTEYQAELIARLHVAEYSFNRLHVIKLESILFGQHYGRIAFEYDGANYRLGTALERFGSGLSQAEAENFVETIKQRFPIYAK